MFASMLQLVNAGNVGLQRPGLEGSPNSPLQLQLLSLELQQTQMLGFKAPSLHDKVLPSAFPVSLHLPTSQCDACIM